MPLQPTREERKVEPLPIVVLDKTRTRLLNQYASLLWRHTDKSKIVEILEQLYETAYSNGMVAMDRMHNTVDTIKSRTDETNVIGTR